MDSLKLAHERELSAQKRANDNAREKLRRFMEYASAVEQERDECRNALLAVVEKGGYIILSSGLVRTYITHHVLTPLPIYLSSQLALL